MRETRMVREYVRLCKIQISAFGALSAAMGYSLASSRIGPELPFLIAGVFVLACGASALNQHQERDVDALMDRTRRRPIPSGSISPIHALYFSFSLILLGIFTLFGAGGLPAALSGVLAVAWYNGLYTYLKRWTAFAVIPGALVGAIPPVIGWMSAGGALKDPRLAALCFFFFMWQVPHFWILLMNYGRDYERAGLPSLSSVFSPEQLRRLAFHWMLATLVSCLSLALYGLMQTRLAIFLLCAATAALLLPGLRTVKSGDVSGNSGATLFRRTNYYLLSIMLLTSLSRFLVI